MPKDKPIGEIMPSSTLILRREVGEATSGDLTYGMSSSINLMTPIVRSQKSGKWFTLSWTDIINLAIKAGIDTNEEPAK